MSNSSWHNGQDTYTLPKWGVSGFPSVTQKIMQTLTDFRSADASSQFMWRRISQMFTPPVEPEPVIPPAPTAGTDPQVLKSRESWIAAAQRAREMKEAYLAIIENLKSGNLSSKQTQVYHVMFFIVFEYARKLKGSNQQLIDVASEKGFDLGTEIHHLQQTNDSLLNLEEKYPLPFPTEAWALELRERVPAALKAVSAGDNSLLDSLNSQLGILELKADRDNAKRLARMWLRSEQILAVLPTVALAGMLGAAIAVLLSLAPAWTGFLIGAIPIAVIAFWAFSASTRDQSSEQV